MADKNRQSGSVGSMGVFTVIAHRTAWLVAIIATVSGIVVAGMALAEDQAEFVWSGVGIAVGGWVGASGLGVLAEISIKLSRLGGD